MTLKATLAALKGRLAVVDPTLVDPTTNQIPITRIYTDPAESLNVSDFPAAVMAIAPQVNNTTSEQAVSYAVEHYTVRIYLFLGNRDTGLEELHQRILPWPRAVATALLADLTLSGAVQYVGDPNGNLFTWSYGPKQWGDNIYFGITFDLPVCEWFQTPMN